MPDANQALAESEPNAAAQAAQSGPESQGPPTRWPIVRLAWPILCLFQLGVIAGLYTVWSRPRAAASDRPAGAQPVDLPHAAGAGETGAASLPPIQPGDMDRADELLHAGRYDQALAAYRSLIAPTLPMPDPLRYRIALCLEGLGRWDEAIGELGRIASRQADACCARAAQLGQARIWLRLKRPVEAQAVLCDLVLKSGQPAFRQHQFLDEVTHLLGMALSMDALGADEPGPRNDLLVAHAACDWRPEQFLDRIAVGVNEQPVLAAAGDHIAVQPLGPSVEGPAVSASLRSGPVAELIERLAHECELGCDWTPAAAQCVTGRFASLSIESLPLPLVLTALTRPLGLVWEITDGVIGFAREPELTEEVLASHRASVAEQVLRYAVATYPSDRLAAAAYLELGHLKFACGEATEAIAWYERVTVEFARSSLAPIAQFNSSVVSRWLGDIPAARACLYRIVDGWPAHTLTPLAYLIIGRTHTEQGDPQRAIAPLRRAVSAASSADVRAAGVIELATSFLLTDNPRAANSVLLEHREIVAEPPYREAAAFIGAYARYRAGTDRKQAPEGARVLIWSLLEVSRESVLGPAGVLLVGRAYRDLGLTEQMAATYERAIRQGYAKLLAPEMSFDLAEFSLTTGKRDLAIEQFTALAAAGRDKWSIHAQLRLAEIARDEGRVEECLGHCRTLLSEANSSEAPAILNLMGKAFEQVGDHRQAALCFAGQVPSE